MTFEQPAFPDPRRDRRDSLIFGVVLAATLAFMVLRHRGMLPMVFADEWLYSQFARLLPPAESALPSWLYLKLFGMTSACGNGFLSCTRLLNTLLFFASAPFIYLVARPVTGRYAAMAITIASLLAPVSSYTAYFMPESTYFFGFWVTTWCLLSARGGHGLAGGVLAGVLLGLMSLVKVHALFLLPALCLFGLWRGWAGGSVRNGFLCALGLAATTVAVRFGVGYLLAGPAALNLLGSFYGSHATNSGSGALLRLVEPMLVNLRGHAMALAIIFALPLLAFLACATSGRVRDAIGQPSRALIVYAVLTLGAALGMTVAYTASIAHAGPIEVVRLHLRYYDFTFPLLWMVAASAILVQPRQIAVRAALVLVSGALLAYAALRILPTYNLSFVDGPEIFNTGLDRTARHIVVGVQALVLALWVVRPQLGRLAFIWVVLPMFTINAVMVNHELMKRALQPNSYDHAGTFAHRTLTPEQRDALAIAGDDLAGLARAQFHVDSPKATTVALTPGEPMDATQLPMRKQYLLVVGDHALPDGLKAETSTPDYALVKLPAAGRSLYKIDFAKPADPALLRGVHGMAPAEPWGAWSQDPVITVDFAQPLPRHMTLFLRGHAFGDNAGKDVILTVGDRQQRFRLPIFTQEVFLRIDTDGAQRRMTIAVPAPEAATPDGRRLGIGIVTLEVGEQEVGTQEVGTEDVGTQEGGKQEVSTQ